MNNRMGAMIMRTLATVLLMGALVLVGCATGGTEKSGRDCGADYRCVIDQVAQYRQQTLELQAMAQQYEAEAEFQATQHGQDSEQTKRRRDLAKQMWSRAQEADQRARDLRSRLPHGVVY